MADEQLNKSFLYLFPVIYNAIIEDCKLNYNYFSENDLMTTIKNTYSYSGMLEFFSISFRDSDKIKVIDKELHKCSFIIGGHSDGDIITYTFSIPDSCRDCYNKFINGKYSKISDNDKKLIVKFAKTFLNGHGSDSDTLVKTIVQVLNKDKARADAMIKMFAIREDDWNPDWEVSSIIDVELENFNY